MSELSWIDDLFLRLETRRTPLHVGALLLFDLPPDAPQDFVAHMVARLRQTNRANQPFDQRLIQRMGMHSWTPDEDFDLDHHFMHIALPQPGSARELQTLVSSSHGTHLDRAFPLWRFYLIEGLPDGRFAVYFKVHHSLIDGESGIRLLKHCMSSDAAQSLRMPPPWGMESACSKEPRGRPYPRTVLQLAGLPSLARKGVQTVAPVLREVRATFRDARRHDPDVVLAGRAPSSLHGGKLSATRCFASRQYGTARMRHISQALNTTLNDVVLAMCGGALRRYLTELGTLPDKPLIAGVPVSIRRNHTAFGNEVAFTLTHLATHLEDPVQRLLAIKRCMEKNKQRLEQLSPGQTLAYAAATLLPGLFGTLLSRSSNRALGNVVVSHVPGPREDLYWQGCRLAGLYPASLLLDFLKLNIAVVSRHDFVDFGLIACRKSVPHAERLLDHLEAELSALEAGTHDQVAIAL